MHRLADAKALAIHQKKEWMEILTSWETRNQYVICDEQGNELYYAGEESGFLSRYFLDSMRPFRIHVVDDAQRELFRLERPFRLLFSEVSVFDEQGRALGTVKRRFRVLGRRYTVYGPDGAELFELDGPLLHPWTFHITYQGQRIGKITKEWSGLLKEAFTDADNFGVSFPAEMAVEHKAVFLGAVFLIDFVHFEKSSKNND